MERELSLEEQASMESPMGELCDEPDWHVPAEDDSEDER